MTTLARLVEAEKYAGGHWGELQSTLVCTAYVPDQAPPLVTLRYSAAPNLSLDAKMFFRIA